MTDKILKDKTISSGDVEIAKIKLSRKKGKLVLSLQATETIENVFINTDVNRSSIYHVNGTHLKYYGLGSHNGDMSNLEMKYNVNLRNYGSALLSGSAYNFSLLRTVGISSNGGIKLEIDGLISSDSIKKYVEEFKKFIKNFYKEYINDITVESELRVKEL